MKKAVALVLSIVLVLVSLSCFAQAEETPKFVTIQVCAGDELHRIYF